MKTTRLFLSSLVACMLLGIGYSNAQCTPRSTSYWGEMLPNAGCGTFQNYSPFGPGQYFRMPVLSGGSYSISTCGATIDTQITGFQEGNNATSIFYNDDNGPICTGTNASITFTPSFTDYANVNVNQYNCLPGGTASITVQVRQNNNLNFTSASTGMCAGATRTLSATPTPVGGIPAVGSGDAGTFSGAGVAGTTFTAPTPAGASQTYTLTYSFGYCSTSQDIIVYNPPSIADAGADQPAICGTSTNLAAITPTIGSGTWSVVSGPGTIATPASESSSVTGLVSGSPTTLRWTVSNGPCSSNYDDVVLTVETIAPVPDMPSLANATGQCSVTPAAPTANDNCAGVINGVPDVVFPITSFGTTVVTWTYDDGSGNIATQSQNVIVTDNSAPVEDVPVLADLNAECSLNSLVAPTATDNCVGPITGVTNASLPITTQGTTTIVWTFDDGNGNTTVQTQNVIINDVTAPTPNAGTLPDVTDACMVSSVVAPTASDNCQGSVTGTPDVSWPVTAQGTTVVTWTFDDGNGNTSTQTQTIIITDTTAPIADLATLSDAYGECSASPAAPMATDSCAGAIVGTPDVSFPITAQGTTVVTWTYDDGNGNTTTQTQNVILTDATAPVADLASLAAVTACNEASPVAPTATDNCAGSVTGTPDVALPITTVGTTTITWTFDDGNGNTSSQTQDVTITAVDVTVTQSGATLTANAAGVSYQWLDCDNGYALILGETDQSLTPLSIAGNFAVEVTDNGCVDTSACYVVDYTGANELVSSIELSIYPNPSNGKFTIELVGLSGNDLALRIVDVQGRVVLNETIEGAAGKHIEKVDISQSESGLYLITIIGEEGVLLTKRIMKD